MKLSCREIVQKIIEGGNVRKKCLASVYHQYKGFIAKLEGYCGDWEQAQDAYIDALLDFEIAIVRKRFEIRTPQACSTFIFHIAKKKVNREKKHIQTVDEMPDIAIHDPKPNMDKEFLLTCMKQLSENCQKILMDWNDGYNMDEIAERVGLKDGKTVAVTKHRCLNKLKTKLKSMGVER